MGVSFSGRLKSVRFSKGYTQKEMAKKLGMSVRMYSYYENGQYDGEQNRIGKYLHKVAQIEKDTTPDIPPPPPKKMSVTMPLIPIDAMAGLSQGNGDAILLAECEQYVIPEFQNKADYLIRVNGSSMYPKYNSGDIVACKKLPLDTFFQWNKVYVLDTVQGPLIKRVKKSSKNGWITLVSDNEKYEPFDISVKAINALALVVGVIRLE